MLIDVVRLSGLSASECARWRQWVASDPSYATPFFALEFTQCAASIRNDVHIARIRDGSGQLLGFFPFQRSRLGRGRPVGSGISDYHGIIGAPDLEVSGEELLRACRLRAFDFDHVPPLQATFRPYQLVCSQSPIIAIREGFDAYVAERRHAHRGLVQTTQRRMRKMSREVAPLRFEYDVRDPGILNLLIKWKSAQYERTGIADRFKSRWIVDLIHRIASERTPGFAGILSALYAGDRVVAAHFGMRSADVLHWWFPSYDVRLSRYSPGSIMLWHLIESAADDGVHTLDLGEGDDAFKARYSNAERWVASGSVEMPGAVRSFRRARQGLESYLRRSPLRGPARHSVRLLRRCLTPLRRV